MKRRKFLQMTGASAASMALLPSMASCLSSTVDNKNYGLGIYTIRDGLEKDFKGSLAKVAEIGYTDLEFWNYSEGNIFGIPANEVRGILDELGLKTSSLHVGIDPLTHDTERVMETAATLGQSYVNCNYLSDNERKSLDDYKSHVDLFNRCGELAREYNIQFGYHNHDFEFESMNGEKPYNLLLEGCDKELVKFEMDMYWMHIAGEKPKDYFDRYPGRFHLWHVKDINQEKQFAPVGQGIIDWKALFAHAELAGLEQYFVEQDQSPNGDPFKDIETSLIFLKKNNL